jgi:hypothetical protein
MPGSWSARVTIITGTDDLIGPPRAAVRRQARPVVDAVKAAWMRVDVTSTRGGLARPVRHTGLRARVAAATGLTFTPDGVNITVSDHGVDPLYGRSLTWYLNGSGRPWRHPIFGRRARSQDWTVQHGQEVFFSTVERHAPEFRAAVERGMEQVAAIY